ncbi:hypothetical protein NE237_029522 [Protea cynaroides]|uniref:Uncharacterized protein n=1 Tax=Protea cynaroides TaxID=273540 RepID=A0A9Q0GUF2_9MAGN|nr:hypothetical protein NE237_029522 [Protea cynaroides]
MARSALLEGLSGWTSDVAVVATGRLQTMPGDLRRSQTLLSQETEEVSNACSQTIAMGCSLLYFLKKLSRSAIRYFCYRCSCFRRRYSWSRAPFLVFVTFRLYIHRLSAARRGFWQITILNKGILVPFNHMVMYLQTTNS